MLLERGVRVRALTYGDCRAVDGLDLERVECNILDIGAVRAGVAGADVVYHVAAAITLADGADPAAERVNETGTRNVALACLVEKVGRLVHFSSIHVLSPYPMDAAVIEDRPLCTGTGEFAYNRSKSLGQRAVLDAVAFGLDAVIVTPTGILGPNDFMPSPMGRSLMDWRLGRSPALLDAGYNFVDVRDVCAGAIAAGERGRTGENYILSGQYLSLKELARCTSAITGCKIPKLVLPLWVPGLAVPLMRLRKGAYGAHSRLTRFTLHTLKHHRRVSHAKATRELGYQPRPIEDTIRDTFNWFDEMGMLNARASARTVSSA